MEGALLEQGHGQERSQGSSPGEQTGFDKGRERSVVRRSGPGVHVQVLGRVSKGLRRIVVRNKSQQSVAIAIQTPNNRASKDVFQSSDSALLQRADSNIRGDT